jgi:hypothetical protein
VSKPSQNDDANAGVEAALEREIEAAIELCGGDPRDWREISDGER